MLFLAATSKLSFETNLVLFHNFKCKILKHDDRDSVVRKCPQLFQAQRQIITKILIKNGEFIFGISIIFDLYILVYFLYIKFYSSICKTREKPICTKHILYKIKP